MSHRTSVIRYRLLRPRRGLLGLAILLIVLADVARLVFAAAPPDVIAEFDIRARGALVTVPVTINDCAYPFVLNTGASGWLFDESLRPLLGGVTDRVVVWTAQGDVGTKRYAIPPMRLGPFGINARSGAACTPFHNDMLLSGEDVYGFLCTEFLRDRIFRVDFDRGKLQFLSRIGNDAGDRLPLTWKRGAPHLTLALPDRVEEDFLIDTGSSGFDTGDLRAELFDELVTAGRLTPVSGQRLYSYSPVAGTVSTPLARLDNLVVGRFRHQGLVFTRSSITGIGLGYLSRYIVTFDLEHSVLYLKPGRGFAKLDRYPIGGVGLVRKDGKTLVDHVDAGSPSEAAGLAESDELVEVDGLPAARTSVFELCRVFATPGKHRVRFRRGADETNEREVTVVLADPE